MTAACDFINEMADSDIVCLLTPEALSTLSPQLKNPAVGVLEPSSYDIVELAVVFGGDGTILRAAEWAVPAGIPLLGVNLEHVGFPPNWSRARWGDSSHAYRPATTRSRRDSAQVTVRDTAGVRRSGSRSPSTRSPGEGRPGAHDRGVGRHRRAPARAGAPTGCSQVTPTGSPRTRSRAGPVLWPDLDALLVVPLLAHALFARPLVLSPTSVVTMELIDRGQYAGGVLWCDGRRSVDVSRTTRSR